MKITKLTKSVLIILFLCLTILIIKNQYSPLLLQNSTYGIPPLIKHGSVENLYIGSSMFRQGLDIHTLSRNASDSYILAYNGNQPALEYYQLKYLIDHNVTIKNLYVDMYVYSSWEAPEISDEKIFMEIDLPEKRKLWELINQDSSISVSLETFWRIFVNSNNEILLTFPISFPILNKQFSHGGTLLKTDSASFETLSAYSAPALKPAMNSTQKYYIKELIHLAKENNINVVFLETPKFETIAHADSYLSAMYTYTKLLDSEQTPYILTQTTRQSNSFSPLTKYYNFDTTNHEYFMDAIHLSSYGREKFTELILSFSLQSS